jgi:uncharacterized protein YidB (DUF937 family)
MLESVKKTLGDGPIATTVTGGLGELIDRFRKAGEGETADSWVGTGPNKPIDAPHMEKALGSDLIGELARQTGLSREELLSRLTQVLPEAVDKLTPEGRLPG